MNKNSRSVFFVLAGIMGLALIAVAALVFLMFGGFVSLESKEPLPILGQVHEFALTNQTGAAVTLEDLKGKVWVADIVFTRCPGPCTRMSTQMKRLQAGLPKDGSVQLISLTADPQFDTPRILTLYGARYDTDPRRWQFLTGPKSEIYRLATEDLLLVVRDNQDDPDAAPEDLFLHSTKFILLDREARLRGIYDGEDPKSVRRILRAIRQLKRQA